MTREEKVNEAMRTIVLQMGSYLYGPMNDAARGVLRLVGQSAALYRVTDELRACGFLDRESIEEAVGVIEDTRSDDEAP